MKIPRLCSHSLPSTIMATFSSGHLRPDETTTIIPKYSRRIYTKGLAEVGSVKAYYTRDPLGVVMCLGWVPALSLNLL